MEPKSDDLQDGVISRISEISAIETDKEIAGTLRTTDIRHGKAMLRAAIAGLGELLESLEHFETFTTDNPDQALTRKFKAELDIAIPTNE